MLLCAGVKPARRGKDVRLRISCDQAEGGRLIVTINFFGTVVIPFIYHFLVGAANRPARRLPGGGLQVRLPWHLAHCLPWHQPHLRRLLRPLLVRLWSALAQEINWFFSVVDYFIFPLPDDLSVVVVGYTDISQLGTLPYTWTKQLK